MTSGQAFDSPSYAIESWLRQAKAGSDKALGELFRNCQSYLLLVANRELEIDLRAKVGPSDVVQESLLEAKRDFEKFDGQSEADFLGWLRKILLNNIGDVRSRYRDTQKRDLFREVSLENEILPARTNHLDTQAPSLLGELIDREQRVAVEAAIENLAPNYRESLQLRHREGCTFEEIGKRTGKSTDAARKIWSRAVEELRKALISNGIHDRPTRRTD